MISFSVCTPRESRVTTSAQNPHKYSPIVSSHAQSNTVIKPAGDLFNSNGRRSVMRRRFGRNSASFMGDKIDAAVVKP